jgi:hypothetical protein
MIGVAIGRRYFPVRFKDSAPLPVVFQNADEKSFGAGVDGLLSMSFLSRFEVQLAGGSIEIRSRGPKK